jgi:hypothetical protein
MHSGFAVRGDDDTAALKPTGIDESVELKIDDDGAVDLKAWENAAGTRGKGTAASPQKGTAVYKVKTHGKGVPRVYRPSGRRTADGFNRYIQELNASMCFNVKEKIEEVEEA